MADENLEKLVKETYLKMIENAEGTRLFNSAFVKNKKTEEVIDVLNDGELSCAFFVSSILTLVGLSKRPHSTVKTVFKELVESEQWELINDSPLPGDVVVWEKVTFEDGTENEHIGFCLDAKTAVSTSYLEKKVVKHSIDFDSKRKIEKILRSTAI